MQRWHEHNSVISSISTFKLKQFIKWIALWLYLCSVYPRKEWVIIIEKKIIYFYKHFFSYNYSLVNEACRSSMGLHSGISVSDGSPIRNVGLRWVSDGSPIGLRLVSDNNNIFMNSKLNIKKLRLLNMQIWTNRYKKINIIYN